MPNVPMPIGTWGRINATEVKPGRWRARARFRDADGVTRTVERFGASQRKSEDALRVALRDRARPSTGVDITGRTTLEDLATRWLESREGEIREQSIKQYRHVIDKHIVPGLGQVRVFEATVGKLDRFMRAIPGAATAKQARAVLTGMFTLAAQHDAVDHNPVREVGRRRAEKKPVRAITSEEHARMRARVHAWAGSNTSGPARGLDLPVVFEMWTVTGGRIGETLAILEEDITWSSVKVVKGKEVRTPARIALTGTVLEDGVRQPFGKSGGSLRTVSIPAYAETVLREQIARDLPSADGLLFPGRHGGPRRPGNVRRQLREALATVGETEADRKLLGVDPTEFTWVTPHSFRRTAGTEVRRLYGVEAAADFLGHSSTAITERHYVERSTTAPDVRDAFEGFAPTLKAVGDLA